MLSFFGTPPTTRRIAIPIVLAIGLLAGSCSSSGSAAPSTTTTPASVGTQSVGSGCPDGTTSEGGLCVSSDPLAQQAADALTAAFAEEDLGAVIAGVWKDGQPLMVGALGESMTGVPATIDMHHRLGNLSEPMLTTAFLQQVDEGALSLTDPLSTWYPDVPGAEQVTVEMLLHSTTGYPHYTELDDFLTALHQDPFRQWDIDDLIDYGVAGGPTFTPGSDWHFSDTNYLLVAQVLEKATGRSVADLLQENVWDPLGMDETTPPLDASMREPVLHGYTDERGVWEDATSWDPTWTWYCGGIASTQDDVRTFLDALGTGELLSEESHEAQIAPTLVGVGPNTADRYWGMGLAVVDGWIFMNPGFSGYFGAGGTLPDQGLTIVVYTTTSQTGDQSKPSATAIFEKLTTVVAPDHPMSMG